MDVEVRPPEAFVWREACALPWTADPDALRALQGIGRTEDVHLSPDNRRLALVGHLQHRLLVLGVRWTPGAGAPGIHLHSPQQVESSALAHPHGAFWIDDQTLMVANRQGDAPLLHIPAATPDTAHLLLEPMACLRAGGAESEVHTPGSVSVVTLPGGLLDVLLCNNYAHHVSRWLIDATNGHRPLARTRLLAHGLRIPDGVAQSQGGRWIAVSNHDDHSVHVYEDTPTLGPDSRPAAVLRGLNYPHGLRWTADARFLLVADAGLPFVHVYERRSDRWEGQHQPVTTLRVLDDERFRRAHDDPQEGGPKGLDLAADGRTLLTTTLEQPLAFFDLAPVLGVGDPPITADGDCTGLASPFRLLADRLRQADAQLQATQTRMQEQHEAHAQELSEVLSQAHRQAADHMAEIEGLRQTVERQQRHIEEVANSRCWRVTAPYRWLRRRLSARAGGTPL